MSSVQKIIDAALTLSTITSVNKEGLLAHRKELESALNSLQILLQPTAHDTQDNEPTELAGQSCQPASSICSNQQANTRPTTTQPESPQTTASPRKSPQTTQPTVIPQPRSPQPTSPQPTSPQQTASPQPMSPRPTVSDQANIEQLMAQLDREERTILEVFRTTSKFAVHHLSWETEDPLLNDAKINKSCAHETLRNVLGSLILADQYTKWEIQNGKKPRVDVLLADLGSGNRNSRYKDYINTKPSMQNKDRGRRFLEYGVKYRVFGHLFAAHAGNGSIFPHHALLQMETDRGTI
ncbi:hypothetical protein MAP00_002822 [Monascus purpureus]|nr:hypothetical protein MAP00_002822 [Monascus purpureus]